VASAEPEATAAFYGGLFGWAHADGKFTLDGRAVAGLRDRGRGPAAWLVSIATDDSAAVAEAARRAAGRVRVPPGPVGAEGTAAILADPAGAVFATWERGSFIGAQVSFEPGAICWYELAARDLSIADDFYSEVFGWRVLEAESQPGDPYFEFHHYGGTVAGLLPMDHRFPSRDLPSHWTVCFMVDDCADACNLTAELGGTVARKPQPISTGWYARLTDPQGASFAIIELADELRMD
jgi:predicted enzyme related to lactoylglutathione lyase